MDKKSQNSKPRRRRTGKKPKSVFGKLMPFDSKLLNERFYKSSYSEATLSSSTAGAITSSIGVSIANSSEYSLLTSQYTEVKLVRARLKIMSRRPLDSSVTALTARIGIGTNMIMNNTTFTLPSSANDVNNLPDVAFYMSCAIVPRTKELIVPKDLMYSNLTADAPATVTPWAGSPGTFQVYGSGFTPSLDYFIIQLDVIWHLRGRQ